MKKYTIDYGMGTAILYTPYPWEARFNTLASTCFGIRKNIMCVNLIDTEDVPCEDFERLEFAGDVYVWREDGARKMLEPYPDDDWDMDLCEECQYQGKEFTEKAEVEEAVDKNEASEEEKEKAHEILEEQEVMKSLVENYEALRTKYQAVLRENNELKSLCQDRCDEIEYLKKERNESKDRICDCLVKKYDELYDESENLKKENSELKKANDELRASLEIKDKQIGDLSRRCKTLESDCDFIHRDLETTLNNSVKYETALRTIEVIFGGRILD